MKAHDNEKKWKNKSISHPILCVASNLFVTLRQSDSSVDGKILNYWAELLYYTKY